MLATGSRIDRYIVEGKIGEGGMATVYRVRHETLGTSHALKVLNITSKEVRNRLLQEGQVQSQLHHENVVRVTDVLPDVQGQPGLLMEFVEGPSLDYWLSRYQPTLEEALTLFRGICAGIGYAHHKGLIHRDLKPANVLLALSEDRMTPKVADFGLAKELGKLAVSGATRTGQTMGTPGYMAPEQIRDASSVDRRADLWSLGCILYRLTCGIPPFEGDDIIELFNQVATGDCVPSRSIRPSLPDQVHGAIERLLEVNRQHRLSDSSVLIDWLDGRIETLPPPLAPAAQIGKAAFPATALPRWLPADGEAAQVARSVVDETLSHLPKLTRAAAVPAPAAWSQTPLFHDRAGSTIAPTAGSEGNDTGPPTAAPVPARTQARSGRPWLLTLGLAGAGLGALGIVGLSLIGAFWIVNSGGTGDPVDVSDKAAPEPAPPVVPPTPAPVEPAPVVPTTPRPAVPPPRPPGPAPSGTGAASVAFSGASALWLESWDRTATIRELGSVPAGRYRILAVFDGGDAVGAGEVTLRSGQRATLKCVSQMARCRVE